MEVNMTAIKNALGLLHISNTANPNLPRPRASPLLV
jgi:hypothetical protein